MQATEGVGNPALCLLQQRFAIVPCRSRRDTLESLVDPQERAVVKRVFSSSEEVAKVWATRSQQEGRTGNGHFFFEGDVAYSYRWSFPVAAMFDAPDGRKFCLVVTDTPSTSTAAVRSLATGAAKEAGCTMIELPSIAPIVELFSRPKRKVGVKVLNAIRSSIEHEVSEIGVVVERSADNSWAQRHRLLTMASLLRIHQGLAAAFELNWPSPASPEAFEARAAMARRASTRAYEDKQRELEQSRKAADRRRNWEKHHPLPPAEELALWYAGERLTLQHQPAVPALRDVRARILEGRFSTDSGWSRPLKDFSRLLSAAVAVLIEREGFRTAVRIGGDNLEIYGNGAVKLGWRGVFRFDEMMACAQRGAPRLHAKAQAAIAEVAEGDEEEAEQAFPGP
jgi:hypothetical protein